jgi:hypothetical protein
VSIGYLAGASYANIYTVAIGSQAGTSYQAANAIAIGSLAGQVSQNANAVAMGSLAGQLSQNNSSISIGNQAGQLFQNVYSIAVGYQAGQNNQNSYAVAMGTNAGDINQSSNTIAIGSLAGYAYQNNYSVAIGDLAGQLGQYGSSVAIGQNAGQSNQGGGAIAIGANAGQSNQTANSIVISASGFPINATTAGTYISPIRTVLNSGNVLSINLTSNEITSGYIFSNTSGNVGIRTTTTPFEFNINGNVTISRKLYIGGANLLTNTTSTANLILAGEAQKTSAGASWIIISDERIKENIETANITICYNNVKSLDLKRYKYRIPTIGSDDKTRLGWIAQEVQQTFPKSVMITPQILDGQEIEDCLGLSVDQIYASMYGAVRKLIEKSEQVTSFSGKGTIETGSLSNVVSVSGVTWDSPILQVTPIFNINTAIRNLNVSTFDAISNSFTVYGGPGDFFWSLT